MRKSLHQRRVWCSRNTMWTVCPPPPTYFIFTFSSSLHTTVLSDHIAWSYPLQLTVFSSCHLWLEDVQLLLPNDPGSIRQLLSCRVTLFQCQNLFPSVFIPPLSLSCYSSIISLNCHSLETALLTPVRQLIESDTTHKAQLALSGFSFFTYKLNDIKLICYVWFISSRTCFCQSNLIHNTVLENWILRTFLSLQTISIVTDQLNERTDRQADRH